MNKAITIGNLVLRAERTTKQLISLDIKKDHIGCVSCVSGLSVKPKIMLIEKQIRSLEDKLYEIDKALRKYGVKLI